MYFQRYYLGCLAHASYMIADEKTKVAAVVDPQRDIEQYLLDAKENGFEIKYVFLTHFHADFISGHIELRDKVGAQICVGQEAKPEYEHMPLKEGDVLEFGKVRMSVLDTPGHTPESISILVYDLNKSEQDPYAVLTGDTLFIGDVGRPDLLASIGFTADQLANHLYDSLHNKLMKLPDETLVYPAHGAGSLCGKQLGDEAVSTIGDQRRYNYALQPMSKADFKRLVTAEQPEAPDYFVHDAILNRQDRDSLQKSMQESTKPLDLEKVLQHQVEGVQIIDTREPVDFAGAHLKGTLNISLDGKYATWCGTILDKAKPIVVIAEPGREEESIMRLGRIGFDQVLGYLKNGVEALGSRSDLVAVTNRITARDLAEQLERQTPPVVIDVRSEKDWSEKRINNASNIPLTHLAERFQEVPTDKMVVLQCRTGYRSSLGASVLGQLGLKNVFDLVGGLEAWEASKLPVVVAESVGV